MKEAGQASKSESAFKILEVVDSQDIAMYGTLYRTRRIRLSWAGPRGISWLGASAKAAGEEQGWGETALRAVSDAGTSEQACTAYA